MVVGVLAAGSASKRGTVLQVDAAAQVTLCPRVAMLCVSTAVMSACLNMVWEGLNPTQSQVAYLYYLFALLDTTTASMQDRAKLKRLLQTAHRQTDSGERQHQAVMCYAPSSKTDDSMVLHLG